MMMDALEKIEKELKKPLMRNDKKGMGLLMAEFDKINKKLGIRREDLPKYEEQLELKIAKAQLEELKKEAVEAMETQKKKRRKKMSCCEGRTRVQRRYHRRGKGGVACLNMCVMSLC
ncbi:probable ATP synthase 24 kDa subunit, mitochondrial [Camellia sinensis]|uniref:probable ATP synthase 24 kDa subunit, mitochondrial n=1 Tax=Camellia sinensis TaxID=4442 RepID=UPI00103686D9|nr:probable ATP synthase 24 kDa subunit, mitochondrial [Camellia sinensis]